MPKPKPKPKPKPDRVRPAITVTLSPEAMAIVDRRLEGREGLDRSRSRVVDELIREAAAGEARR